MSRVLFCVIPEKGHLNPMIGPAQCLASAGHDVGFWAPHDVSAQLTRAGLGTFLGDRARAAAPDASRGARFASQVDDPAWLRAWIRGLLVDAAPPAVAPLRAVIRAFAPDVIALDPMVYPAVIAAELEGRPWAALSNSLNPVIPDGLDSELLATVRALAPAREALFADHGLRLQFRGCDALSPHLTVAFATREFVGRDVPGVHLVGPSLPRRERGDEEPFPWDRTDPARPLVYMSLGSQIYYQPRMFRVVIDAVAKRALTLALSVSDLAGSDALGALPDNVFAVRYAPQLQVLSRARALITHGGANSVMEALHAGVPMLVSPICNDQFHQGHFVREAGVGAVLDLKRATAHDVGVALDAILPEGPIRARTREVSASYRVDGAARAAALLIALASGSHPEPG